MDNTEMSYMAYLCYPPRYYDEDEGWTCEPVIKFEEPEEWRYEKIIPIQFSVLHRWTDKDKGL
jgi:hypothetical protein